MQVNEGRFTPPPLEEPLVVFLIGMRINAWWKPWRWVPVFAAMPKMLQQLESEPERGLLAWNAWFGRTTIMTTYWRSHEHLERFATDMTATHVPAWRGFQRAMRGSTDAGVWHETYVVRPGDVEAIYVNLPDFGLGKALGLEPVGRDANRASARMRRGQAVAS